MEFCFIVNQLLRLVPTAFLGLRVVPIRNSFICSKFFPVEDLFAIMDQKEVKYRELLFYVCLQAVWLFIC